MVRASFAVCFLLAAPSCPDLYSLATHGFVVPTLDAPTGTATPDPAGVRVDIKLSADNPNPFPLSMSGVDYTVALQGTPVFAGSAADPELPEHASGTVDLIGVVDATSPTYRGLRPGQTVPYTIGGTAHVSSPAGVPIDVEFDLKGTFVVPSNLPAPR